MLHGIQDLSSVTRNWTCAPCSGGVSPNPWTSRESPPPSHCLSLVKTLDIGFRDHLDNPQWHHLESLTLIISAKTLFPNKFPFTDLRWTHRGLERGTSFNPLHRLKQKNESRKTCGRVWAGRYPKLCDCTPPFRWGMSKHAPLEAQSGPGGLHTMVRSRVCPPCWHFHEDGKSLRSLFHSSTLKVELRDFLCHKIPNNNKSQTLIQHLTCAKSCSKYLNIY